MSEKNKYNEVATQWTGEQIGVNSDTPLMDQGTGQAFFIRQFLFSFSPEMVQKIKDKKGPFPTEQQLFNSCWPQLRVSLWGDGLIAVQESLYPPKIVIGKKKYKIILTCMPKHGVMVNEHINTLQEVLKPQRLTKAKQ